MKTDKIIDYISWTLLCISLLMLKVTPGYVENIIRGKKFVFEMAGVGLILASVWMYFLFKVRRSYFEGEEKRAGAILSQFFSIIILSIFLSTIYNYYSGRDHLYTKKVFVADKSKNARYGTTYVTLVINNREERFNPSSREWKKIIAGDSLDITIGKGLLNYEFIYQFHKP